MRVAAVVLMLSACLSGAPEASAQETGGRLLAVTAAAAPVFVLPDADRTPLRTLPPGTRLRILREDGSWLRVEFDDPWWGARIGYIERRHVEITEDFEPSRPRDAPPMQPRETAAPARAPSRGTVGRVWIDVNGAVAVARTRDYGSIAVRDVNGRSATFRADYHLPAGPAFDLGAGVLVTRQFGIGATLAGAVHEDPAALTIELPHPILPGPNAVATAETIRAIRRRESSLHLHGVMLSQPAPELRTRVFAGPTYFRVEQDAIQDIRYEQSFLPFEPVHEAGITSASILRMPYRDATGWGFHAGADASWFVTRALGVGAFGRYSRGTVEIRDPLTGSPADLEVGGFQAGGGVRVRF